MSLSSRVAKIASNVIKKYGTKITFTAKTSTGFNPATGVDTTTTVTFTGYGVKAKFDKSEVDNENTLFSDIKLLLEKTTVAPKIGNTCKIGSIIYRIMGIEPIDPANENIIYIMKLRV